jgi:hypothetical protein
MDWQRLHLAEGVCSKCYIQDRQASKEKKKDRKNLPASSSSIEYIPSFFFSQKSGLGLPALSHVIGKINCFLDRFRMTCSEARHWISDAASASDSDWTKQFPQLDRGVCFKQSEHRIVPLG